jgi:predicted RNA binding protein YcfA (HicA-like mRNA interferase family)
MKGLSYTPERLIRKLIDNGWKFARSKSNHSTYTKANHRTIITVPTHKHEISRPIVVKLLKMAGIR